MNPGNAGGGKEPWFGVRLNEPLSLATPEKIRKLQRALYVKAKQEPTRRFHFLYDKVWREDILAHAYALSHANGGVPGVDGETFSRIDAYEIWHRFAGKWAIGSKGTYS